MDHIYVVKTGYKIGYKADAQYLEQSINNDSIIGCFADEIDAYRVACNIDISYYNEKCNRRDKYIDELSELDAFCDNHSELQMMYKCQHEKSIDEIYDMIQNKCIYCKCCHEDDGDVENEPNEYLNIDINEKSLNELKTLLAKLTSDVSEYKRYQEYAIVQKCALR
jgi:hypothetical protein